MFAICFRAGNNLSNGRPQFRYDRYVTPSDVYGLVWKCIRNAWKREPSWETSSAHCKCGSQFINASYIRTGHLGWSAGHLIRFGIRWEGHPGLICLSYSQCQLRWDYCNGDHWKYLQIKLICLKTNQEDVFYFISVRTLSRTLCNFPNKQGRGCFLHF